MRVLVAPNAFRGSLEGRAVASHAADGVRRAFSDAVVEEVALADGGDGTLEVLARACSARVVAVKVTDALHRPISGRLALSADGTAIVEMAEVSGLRRLREQELAPMRASTRGTGELIRHALDRGARRILVGAGGSATIDGGAGALAALGARFLDAGGQELQPIPARLTELAAVDLSAVDGRVEQTEIVVLSDVRTPLSMNARTFGAQKGLDAANFPHVDEVLRRLDAAATERARPFLHEPWLGAGGGLAAGLSAFAGATVTSGAQFIGACAGLPCRLQHVDLLITGEGRVDHTTFEGKLPGWLVTAGAKYRVPTAMISGAADRNVRVPEGTLVLCTANNGAEATDRVAVATAIGDLAEYAARTLLAEPEPRFIDVDATRSAT